MAQSSESIGTPHPEQTRALWERVAQGIHVRLRARACGEIWAVTVLIGPTTAGPHRNAGQIMLTPSELAEIHKTFKGGCGLYGWRSDMEVITG